MSRKIINIKIQYLFFLNRIYEYQIHQAEEWTISASPSSTPAARHAPEKSLMMLLIDSALTLTSLSWDSPIKRVHEVHHTERTRFILSV